MIRLIRRLLMPFIILAGLAIGASIYVEAQVEKRVAMLAQDRFGLAQRPRVDIGGGLVLLNVFSGTIPEVTMEADDVRVRSLELRTTKLTLRELSVDGSVLGSGDLTVTVGEGEATATTDEAAINALLRREGEDATVRLLDGQARVRARRVIGGARRTIVATGRFRVSRSVLTFVPRTVTVDGERPPAALEEEAKRQARVSVRLPRLPGDFTIEQVVATPGTLTFTSRIEDEKLELSG